MIGKCSPSCARVTDYSSDYTDRHHRQDHAHIQIMVIFGNQILNKTDKISIPPMINLAEDVETDGGGVEVVRVARIVASLVPGG